METVASAAAGPAIRSTASGLTKSSSGGSRCVDRSSAATWKTDAGGDRDSAAATGRLDPSRAPEG